MNLSLKIFHLQKSISEIQEILKIIQPGEDEQWEVLEKIKAAANKLNPGETVIMRNTESPYLNQEWKVLDSNGE